MKGQRGFFLPVLLPCCPVKVAVVEYLHEFVGHRLLEEIAAFGVDENNVRLPDFRVDFLGNNPHRGIVEEGAQSQPVIFPHVNYEQMKTKALPRESVDVEFDCSFSRQPPQ